MNVHALGVWKSRHNFIRELSRGYRQPAPVPSVSSVWESELRSIRYRIASAAKRRTTNRGRVIVSFQHRFVQGLGVEQRMRRPNFVGRILLVLGLFVLGTQAASADVSCTLNMISLGWVGPIAQALLENDNV
jgi:hypothetical protein